MTNTPEDTELKKIIDKIIPQCGEIDCDVCDKRHIKLAKKLDDLITLHTQKAQFPYQETYSFLHSYHKDVLEELEEHLAQLTNPTEREA